MTLSADVQQTRLVRDLIDDLLSDPRQLGPDYQPIARLADRTVVGHKATGRGKPGTPLADTLSLLEGAQSTGLVERIDWAFRALAFDDFFGRTDELHLTPEPETFGAMCPPRFASAFARARRELHVAAEVHGEAFADSARLSRGLAELREWGWRVVVADVADDDHALSRIGVMRPDVVQVDLRLPGRAPESGHAGLRRLLAVASDCGAELMALGVDDAARHATALALGCTIGRGASYGGPGVLRST